MVRLANCPQCEDELLVPDGTNEGAWARCPRCQAFFQMKDAKSRELAAVELVGSAGEAEGIDPRAAKTVEELSTAATWAAEPDNDDELQLADDSSSAARQLSSDEGAASPGGDLGFADLAALFDDDSNSVEPQVAEPLREANFGDAAAETAGAMPLSARDEESLEFAEPADDTSPEATIDEASQRIDAWFRSAKTIADVPPLSDTPVAKASNAEDWRPEEADFARTDAAAAGATIDLGRGGIDELKLNDDFELEAGSDEHTEGAAWDDSQHMDRLLAGFEDEPREDREMAGAGVAAAILEPREEHTSDWTPGDEAVSVTPKAAKPRRKRSFVRTFAMTTLGGLLGLALGYYVLLWVQGPPGDFLNWAHTLPKVLLPKSFSGPSHLMAAAPAVQPKTEELAPVPPASETGAPTDDAAKTADAAAAPAASPDAAPADAPAEQQASFTEPVEAAKAKEDDRQASAAPPNDKPAEPATLDAPPATPLSDAPPAQEAIKIAGAPTFTASDVSTALAAGKDAVAGLIDGNLTDGHEVGRKKGFSYSLLADLAQKVTLIDPAAAGAAELQQDADAIYRETLATPHAREEVAQIVPKWIASPNRRQGGIFFAGSVVGEQAQGSVKECSVDLGNGQSLAVLMSPALQDQWKGSAAPVAVVGWIVDKPAESVPGYTGTAAQAVYASRLIPLE